MKNSLSPLSATRMLLAMAITLFFLLVLPSASSAQNQSGKNQRTLTGIVLDKDTNEPLIGVTILDKNTQNGTITDFEGKFTLPITHNRKQYELILTYIGYARQEISTNGHEPLVVKMEPETVALDQVVVVGYGTQKKSDVTGSVAAVSKDRIENSITTDITQLLQGSVPGLNVMSTAAGSDPSAGSVMLVRGRNSISASNEPLIVLDGVPYYGSISDIGTNEIEAISVLKDASAAAIYGARAAAGVILIETKKGKKGKLTVSLDAFYGLQNISNFPELMNGEQYINYKAGWTNDDATDEDAALNDYEKAVYQDGSYNDWSWKKLLTRTGHTQNYKLGLSGGTDQVRFNLNASYLNTKGIVINDNYDRLNTRLNLTSKINDYITVGNSVGWTYIDRSGASPNFTDVFNKSPLSRPFNSDGSININPTGADQKVNPLECLLYDDQNVAYSLNATNYVEIKLPWVKGLSYKLNTNVQYGDQKKNWYRGNNTKKSGAFGGEGEMAQIRKYSYMIENIVNYGISVKKHDINLTALYSIEESHKEGQTISGTGFSDDQRSFYGIYNALETIMSPLTNDKTRIHSVMGRINYSYDSRYLLTATVRHDASSVLGRYKHWGTFPSVALGWNISNEKFFKPAKDIMNTLKLRLSVGKNGQNGVSPYSTLATMKDNAYTDGTSTMPGYIPGQIGSSNLGWEEMTSYNFGIDMAFLNNRFQAELNVYKNKNTNLLLQRTVSLVHGINKVIQNIGKTENKGVEISITSNNITSKTFSWQTGLSLAWNDNKIVDLYGDGTDDITNKWFIGHPVLSNYDYKIIGIWQEDEATEAAKYGAKPGYAKYEDLNGNGEIDPEDRQIIGSSEPDFTFSLSNTFRYKQLSLMVILYGATGATKANPFKDRSYFIVQDFWNKDNAINTMWSTDKYANKYLANKSISPSSYENANFARIKDITLTYNFLPRTIKKIGLSKLAVYFTGKNLFTFTSWKGMDPEFDTQRAIPVNKEFSLGLNLGF